MRLTITKNIWFYSLFYLLLLAALSVCLYQQNQPVDIVAPTSLAQNKVQCVSYAPFYKKGTSPLEEDAWVSKEQVEQDLAKLSQLSHCVRTYSVGQGMDYVPEVAQKLGLKVYLGIWIGWTDADNREEIELAAKVANAYPETVKALIVGNEVFLRGEQDKKAMKAYFALAKQLSDTPITYADVWEYWVKYKDIAPYIDFITVHILPYWENDPVAIEDGVQHAEKAMQAITSLFSKPILIGETGWPSVGRQRHQSKPSQINQAKYIRGFIQKAHEQQWQYNLIEAIDQPWKRTLEGTVGGYWGVMNPALEPKFPLTGAVTERQDGNRLFYIGLAGALLLLSLAYGLGERQPVALLGLGAVGAVGGLVTLLQYEYVVAACRDWIEWVGLGGLFLLSVLTILLQAWQVSCPKPWIACTLKLILQVFVLAALVTGYLIYFDGRYRDFPIVLFALPAVLMAVGGCVRPLAKVKNYLLYALPIALAVMFAVLCVEKEPDNCSALIWLGIIVCLALISWPTRQQNNMCLLGKR